jgi:hypothetical protein
MLIKIYPIQITDFKSDRRYTQYLFAFTSKTSVTKKIVILHDPEFSRYMTKMIIIMI